LITCDDKAVVIQFKKAILQRFDGTDEGPVKQYLGCEVIHDVEGGVLTLKQSGYAERVLKLYSLWDAPPVKTPMRPGERLSKNDCPQVVNPALHCRYRGIIGHLSFLVQMTRPDLAYAYAELSKFCQCPGLVHMQAAERVLQYLKGTFDVGITWSDPGDLSRNVLGGWVDSDFAADPDTRRSVSGFVMSLNGGPVAWKSKRQSCTTLSSAEAEFVAASICGQEVIYLRALLRSLGHGQVRATRVYEDNASCIAMSENPVNAERSRHIDTRWYFIRDLVRDRMMKLVKCAGTHNVTDALTKSLPSPSYEKHMPYMLGTLTPYDAGVVTKGV
jgi:hypothetical protein